MSILDCDLIIERRSAAGLSRFELGERLGVGAQLIRRVEDGTLHGERTLDFVVSLAKILGVSARSLVLEPNDSSPASPEGEPDDSPPADVDRLAQAEAALMAAGTMVHRDDLARTLGLTPAQTLRLLEELEAKLVLTGLALQRGAWGYVKLVARHDRLTPEQHTVLERAKTARMGLKLRTGRVLAQVLAGEVDPAWQRSATLADRVALASLLKQGLVRQQGARVVPTPQLLYDLGLDDEPELAQRKQFQAFRSRHWAKHRHPLDSRAETLLIGDTKSSVLSRKQRIGAAPATERPT